jgi:hypothetical protein
LLRQADGVDADDGVVARGPDEGGEGIEEFIVHHGGEPIELLREEALVHRRDGASFHSGIVPAHVGSGKS